MGRPGAPRGQGRDRVVAAALELFSERGVSGTSLQMIADSLGVGKASVYYQFKTKDDIIQAVIAPAFEQIRHILAETEASPAPQETLVASLVDLVIAHREVMAALSYDPAVRRFLESHEEASALILKLGQTLLGPAPAARRRVATSMFGAALSGVGVDPNLADIDDATLRRELIDLGRTLLHASAANQI
ncbi:TetR/AcrR family transcriptional regulator [Arthrobacter sp. ISL-48]|nr:TetR/AcrR family transcriptional regulator [Arthrobacter sp. ISL-48]